MGISDDVSLPRDSRLAYRAPKSNKYQYLDNTAVQNIKDWYSSDYQCIHLVRDKYYVAHGIG